ncbi:glycosyltransferase family 2 protein [Aeromonas media]|uniref:glycosyltransferase family 2 protein n=1 Tax=Aeromonas media TaxID=651 RepID=UPI003D1E1F36
MLAICAIFKNEHPYILEWLAYHRCLDIHHFYIADNISTDGTSELLIALDKINVIKRYPYPTELGMPPQIMAYNALLTTAEDEWLAFIDADEFITPNNYEEGLIELVTLLDDDKVSAIALNWSVYGSSCSIIPENALVIERLTRRANKDHPVNQHYKSIVRKRDTLSAGKTPHDFSLHEGKSYIKTSGAPELDSHGLSRSVDWEKARINHYVIKSQAEFFTKKATRGRATTLDTQLNRTLSFFRSHDLNQIEDNIPRWFVNKVKDEKESLVKALESVGYDYHEFNYQSPLYRTAHGMGKGCIDFLNVTERLVEFRGWVIDKNNYPVESIIAVINSIRIQKCINLKFRDRNDLSLAGLGTGIRAGFNTSIFLPDGEINKIDFYGLDRNGLVIVEIKGNFDIIKMINNS